MRFVRAIFAAGIALATASSAVAGEIKTFRLFVEGEVFRADYFRDDGLRVGVAPGESLSSLDQLTGRLTFGAIWGSTGIRIRGFRFDERDITQNGPSEFLSAKFAAVDVEAFRRFQVARHFNVDLSAGVRGARFDEHMQDDGDVRTNSVRAWGPIVGFEARWRAAETAQGHYLILLAGARAAALFGHHNQFNNEIAPPQNTSESKTRFTSELFAGLEFHNKMQNGVDAYLKLGYSHMWLHDFSAKFTPGAETFAGYDSVGLRGWTLGVGFIF